MFIINQSAIGYALVGRLKSINNILNLAFAYIRINTGGIQLHDPYAPHTNRLLHTNPTHPPFYTTSIMNKIALIISISIFITFYMLKNV